MNSIPVDLVDEILSRLPAKSIARFRCVSKLWGSMLCRTYFTELFLTRSSSRPRLLFAVQKEFEWLFFSSLQPQNPYEKSSLVVSVDFHMKISKDTMSPCNWCYASGLIYFRNMWIKKEKHATVRAICNPSTGQYAILHVPELKTYEGSASFLGFDPINKQYKVLFMSTINYIVSNETVQHISTLGTGETIRWRNIQCPFAHEPLYANICINGILYYQAIKADGNSHLIVCFDVRSEKFKFIDAQSCGPNWSSEITLTNYKGKLGVIKLKYKEYDGGFPLKLRLWVLEDVEKQEWSGHVYTLRDENQAVKVNRNLSVAPGMTAIGEIVLLMRNYTSKEPFYVFYFNPERNTLQNGEIQGVKEERFNNHRVYAFVDHVEDLNFNIMKKSETSVSPREEKGKPTITPTSSRQDHQVRTVAHMQHNKSVNPQSHQHHQVRTVGHMQQDRRTYESANKFNALCLLDDDDFTGHET